MTHEYTLLVGGTVIPGGDLPDAAAIAWAEDTILALGTDEEVRAISRGDSHLVELHGAFVVGLAPGAAAWEATADRAGSALEVGGRADLVVLLRDPRVEPAGTPGEQALSAMAVIRGGRVVAGALPGVHAHGHGDGAGHDIG